MYALQWDIHAKLNDMDPEPDFDLVESYWNQDNPQVVAIDTETTGLNIVKDTPFLFIVAWKVQGSNVGRVFVLPYISTTISRIMKLFKSCRYIVGANIKYDLHILRNGGSPFPFEILNDNCEITDVRILRRLTMETDASPQDERLALKQMGSKFIDSNANADETNIAEIKRQLTLQHRQIAKTMLKPYQYTLKDVEDTINDSRYGIEALPENIRNVYLDWEKHYGEVTYKQIYDIKPYDMNKYASVDGILTVELFLYLFNQYVIINNKTGQLLQNVYKQENQLIQLYYKQEEIGFKVDLNYLSQSKVKVAHYTLALERELHLVLGEAIGENQHKELMRIFKNKFKVNPELFLVKGKEKMDKNVVKKLMGLEGPAGRAANIITRLRRCRKWLSTYIDGIYKAVLENGDGRYHPSSDQAGTVSGRISGTMQQMPKDPLLDGDGNELFHPRKIIIPSGGDYQFLVLQDFDQMELRVQADYTINYGVTDDNLCKIFIPLNCRNKLTGKIFQPGDPTWNQKDENGNSIWLEYNGKPWEPIDPHGMHVKTAFGLDKPKDDTTPEFKHYKHLRNAAKTINFAVNYGSGLKGLLENPMLEDYSKDTVEAIYNAYKTNFVGVGQYQLMVQKYVYNNLYIANRYGRVYRVNDARWAYKCANYLIQGSCADLVKNCLIQIDNLFKKYNAKSRVLYTVHDEIIWELHKDEGWLIFEVEKILNTNASWCKIPLTCGTDLAYTNWAEKKDISNFLPKE